MPNNWTPGPWVIKEADDGFELQFASGGWIFRLTDGRVPTDTEKDPSFIESQLANALLIASAPALYEALKSMVGRFGGSAVCSLDTMAITEARAALATAADIAEALEVTHV